MWEASTPPGTPCSPRTPAGAQGAEPSQIPGEVRAFGGSCRGKGIFYVLPVPSGDKLSGLLLQGG